MSDSGGKKSVKKILKKGFLTLACHHKSAAGQAVPNGFLAITRFSQLHTITLWLLYLLKSELHNVDRNATTSISICYSSTFNKLVQGCYEHTLTCTYILGLRMSASETIRHVSRVSVIIAIEIN